MPKTPFRTPNDPLIVSQDPDAPPNQNLIRGEDRTAVDGGGVAVLIRGGDTTSAAPSTPGGDLILQGGAGFDASMGGTASLLAGTPGASAAGANVVIAATSSLAASGVGGSISMTAGDSTGVANAGSLTFTPGAAGGSGADGLVIIGGSSALQFTEATTVPGSSILATQGRIWVRDDTPNVLVFTDDAGTDTVLGVGTASGQTGLPYNDAQFYVDVQNPESFDGTDPPIELTDLRGSFPSAGTVSNVTVTDGHFTFNGTTSEVDMGTLPSALEDLFDGGGTVEAWIRVGSDGESNAGRIADTTDSTTEGWVFFVDNEFTELVQLNLIQYFDGTLGGWNTTARVIPLNQWVHVAVVYDASSDANDPVLYVDGVEYSIAAANLSETSSPSGSVESDSGNGLFIGNRSDQARTFDGDIERVMMWDRLLSADEVAQLRRSGLWRLDPNVIGLDTVADTKDMVVRTGVSSAGDGGGLFIQAGNTEATSGTHTGGALTAAGGDSSAPSNSSDGGAAVFRGGDYLGAGTAPGGDLTLRGGDGGNGTGGNVLLRAGECASGNTAPDTSIQGGDNTDTGAAGDTTVRAGDCTAAGSGNTSGGDLGLRSGQQRGGGTPGSVVLRSAGPSNATASVTGDITITTRQTNDPQGLFGDQGGTDTDSGSILISTGPVGATANISGDITFVIGDTGGGSGNDPGEFLFTGGSFTTANNFARGSSFTINCGDGNADTSGGGGNFTVTGGNNTGTGAGGATGTPGAITLTAGDENHTGGGATGGLVTISAGDGVGTNTIGGTVTVNAGAGTGTEDGGDIILNPGVAGGSGSDGEVTVNGKLTVTGLIDPTGLVLMGQGANPTTPTVGEGVIWVDTASPNRLVFSDDAGTDILLSPQQAASDPNVSLVGGTEGEIFRETTSSVGQIWVKRGSATGDWELVHTFASAPPGGTQGTIGADGRIMKMGQVTPTAGATSVAVSFMTPFPGGPPITVTCNLEFTLATTPTAFPVIVTSLHGPTGFTANFSVAIPGTTGDYILHWRASQP